MKYLPLDTAGVSRTGYQQQVKESNIKQIFDLVRGGRCKSRAEIVRMMNLSATSVSVLVEDLAARRLIREAGPTQTSLPGRRPISLRLNADARQMAVFTIRRDGVNYALLNLDCRVIESAFYPYDAAEAGAQDAGEGYAALFEDILNHRARRFNRKHALMLGVVFPGFYIQSEHQFRSQAELGVDFSEDAMCRLRDRLELPVYLLNATKSLAYAEKKRLDAIHPDAPETRDMLFVEINRRIAGANIAAGNLYTGPYNIAGEIGHITIDYNGRLCACGNAGCLERYVSQTAILEDAREACEAAGIPAPETLQALAERYGNEPVLSEVVSRAARLLAFGLYSMMCGSGMRNVVLGGGIEVLGEPFLREVYRAMGARNVLIRHMDLSYAQSGPNAESIGLAQHFLDKMYTITM